MSTDRPGNPAARELGYCPCCGYMTLPPGAPGSGEECPICRWTDDAGQFSDAEEASGANGVSLARARENFERVGAATRESVPAARDPDPGEPRDPNWPY